jgi:uncharacterized repeat protein (TIGR03803 family)
MASSQERRIRIFGLGRHAATATLVVMLALRIVAVQPAHAQTFQIIHNFTDGVDGGGPYAGLTIDTAGNLYGTATLGGMGGGGTVFKMTHNRSGWTFAPIYNFTGGSDGSRPEASVTFGAGDVFYGTTTAGGVGRHGVVFKMTPPVSVCPTTLCFWPESALYQFMGTPDGSFPASEVTFDAAGNIYGTTRHGGSSGQGTVYKLSPSGSGWTETVLYSFGGSSGANPISGVIFDNSGNLYGTTIAGGVGYGTVYQLTPTESGWVESTIYTFQGGSDGGGPWGSLILDQSGNLYGTTYTLGRVFELKPSGNGWTYTVLYTFGGNGPNGNLTLDAAGNLYGVTTQNTGHPFGEVFELTPSGQGWQYTNLHTFDQGDGLLDHEGGVVIDASGNLYGTNELGGAYGDGAIWEITRQ